MCDSYHLCIQPANHVLQGEGDDQSDPTDEIVSIIRVYLLMNFITIIQSNLTQPSREELEHTSVEYLFKWHSVWIRNLFDAER